MRMHASNAMAQNANNTSFQIGKKYLIVIILLLLFVLGLKFVPPHTLWFVNALLLIVCIAFCLPHSLWGLLGIFSHIIFDICLHAQCYLWFYLSDYWHIQSLPGKYLFLCLLSPFFGLEQLFFVSGAILVLFVASLASSYRHIVHDRVEFPALTIDQT